MLEGLAIPKACLVGHSWGGYLAMHVAVARPDVVLGLVSVGTLGAVGDGGMAAMGATLDERYAAQTGRSRGKETPFAEQIPFYFASPATAPPFPDLRIRNSRETFASIREHFALGTLANGLPQLDVPVAFVHGLLDPIPASAAVDSAALIRGAVVDLLKDCGHFPWIEQPGSVHGAMTRLTTMARS